MASNGIQSDATKFFNYPDPKNVEIPYKSPDAPKNPVVRGLPLYYGASLYARSHNCATTREDGANMPR